MRRRNSEGTDFSHIHPFPFSLQDTFDLVYFLFEISSQKLGLHRKIFWSKEIYPTILMHETFFLRIDWWSVKITLMPLRCPRYIPLFMRQIFWKCIIYYSFTLAPFFLFFWYRLSTGLECRLPTHSLDSGRTNIMADVFIFFLKRRGGYKTITS